MTENNTMEQQPANGGSNLLAILGIIIVVGVVAFVMMRSSDAPEAPVQENTIIIPSETEDVELEATDEAETEDAMEEGVVEVEMEAGMFYFEPSVMEANLGDTVRITMTSVDMDHDFVLDEFDVQSEVIDGGETTTFEFVVDQLGEFEFYCSVGSHRQLGMVGTLVVEE